MAFDYNNPFSLPASTDLSASQYCAVTIDSNGRIALPSAGGQAIGILYTGASVNAIDKAGEVFGAGSGIRKARYGGTVTAGQALKVDSSGRFITALAADVALGSAMAIAVENGVVNEIHSVIFFGNSSVVASVSGVDDIVLGTTAPSGITEITFVQTTGTKTGVLPNGLFVGQKKRFVQSVAASTPVGTITGAFQDLTGAAKTTLALGAAVAVIADLVWVVGAWRLDSAITGTGSSLS